MKSCKELLLAQLNVEQKGADVTAAARYAMAVVPINEYNDHVGSPDFLTHDFSTTAKEVEDVRQAFLKLKQARKELSGASQKLVEFLPKLSTIVSQEYLIDKMTLEAVANKY